MSKKQLPKRTLSFKLEKHPTAERLESLRAQGIENLDDLDRLSNESIAPSPTPSSISNPTASAINLSETNSSYVDPSVVTNGSESGDIAGKSNVSTANDIKNKTTEAQEVATKASSSFDLAKTNIIDTASTINSHTANAIDSRINSHTDSHTDIPTSTTTALATATKNNQLSVVELFSQLQETHSLSAQIIFELLGKLANERGKETIRIGTKQLLEKTQIKSHVTIRKAIDELLVKCSLEIIEANQGKIPPVYKIVDPEKILSLREQKELLIDEDTKFAFQAGKRVWPNSKTINEGIPISNAISIPTANSTNQTIANNISIPIKTVSADLTVRINELKGVCKQLGVTITDSPKLIELTNYPLPHIIIGICQKVEQSKEPITLIDCLPEILEHYQSMNALPEAILAKVAYDYFLRLKQKA